MIASTNDVKVSFTYWTSTISVWLAENFASTFATVLESILAGHSETVEGLGSLSSRDNKQLLAWNSGRFLRDEDCVHEIFSKRASENPQSPAVCAWDAEFTYLELDQLSDRLAHYLVDNGLIVAGQSLVPLCFNKSAWTIVAMLAVLKAGGGCVSLDPSHPSPRLQAIFSETGSTSVLVGCDVAKAATDVFDSMIVIDSDFIQSLPIRQKLNMKMSSQDTAFVIYTSGSTGIPKGVVLEHGSVCTSARAHGTALNINPQSRVLQFASHVFDISIQDMFTTIMRGGCICVPSEDERRDDVPGAIQRMNVNWACLTPTVAALFKPSSVPSLRTLTLAGEALSSIVVKIWDGSVDLNNCYGPAESTIYCSWNGAVGKSQSASNIGTGLSSLLWVVDPTDHHRLLPLGCIGELLIEGPLLARGYLNDEEKTNAAFIWDPTWSRCNSSDATPRRMYKTGDLVRYNSDGSLDYLGRKDSQVKIHGQRLELGEIEYHLNSDVNIKNSIVLLPKKGPGNKTLVAIIAFKQADIEEITENSTAITVVQDDGTKTEKLRLADQLATQLPSYMVPTSWIIIHALPLNTSGKLDRAKIAKWLEDMQVEVYLQATETHVDSQSRAGPTTTMDHQLQSLVGRVLNLPTAQIGFDRSFQRLGGDSITAMQLVSRSRSEGILLRVQDILRARSLTDLALIAKFNFGSSISRDDEVDKEFGLTPVQQLYFQLAKGEPNQFNQSFFLRLTQHTQTQDISRAVESLVLQHSMLRARFVRKQGRDEEWKQLISKDISKSFRFRQHDLRDRSTLASILQDSQTAIDPIQGPIFVVDLLNINGDGQFLFLVAHHLVIDLVSWRVILHDLEEILSTGSLRSKKPFPFQSWAKYQAEYASKSLDPTVVLTYDVEPADFGYWGMADKINPYSDVKSESFTLDPTTTELLLGVCQDALATEPIEIFMASLVHSFSQTFKDRSAPTLFTESHGREPWVPEIDVSDTVGWFTTMAPLFVNVPEGASPIDIVRQLKETRRKLPNNGWSYFTSRFLNEAGISKFADHLPMEVVFNYLGRYQQLERADSLLIPEAIGEGAPPDVGPSVPRLAMFEVSVVVLHGITQCTVVYGKEMQRQTDISKWIRTWKQELNSVALELSQMKPDRSLSDFPLLSMSDEDFDVLKVKELPKIGVQDFSIVENIYPCSPIQQGLLLSQAKVAGNYQIDFTYAVTPAKAGTLVDIDRLLQAWQQVIERHSILRTLFVDSVSNDNLTSQLVLKQSSSKTRTITCDRDEDVIAAFHAQPPIDSTQATPRHQLTLCSTNSGLVCARFELSHAIMDATSMSVILRDITQAYEGVLPKSSGPLYSNYIEYLLSRPLALSLEYWRTYLSDVQPCQFPTLQDFNSVNTKELRSLQVPVSVGDKLQAFCLQHGITIANVAQAVWGLVIRSYTGSNDICFGYLSSGRDVAVDGIEEMVGPLINMLVCRLEASPALKIVDLIQQVQKNYLASLEHQHCSLADIQHELKLHGRPLFNTIMSVQRGTSRSSEDSDAVSRQSPELSFRNIGAHDPTEVISKDRVPQDALTECSMT